jgi:dTDP-4-dehydrorhamnose reductase
MNNESIVKNYKILILGGTGMLGHVLLRYIFENTDYDVYATTREIKAIPKYFSSVLATRFGQGNVDVNNFDSVISAMATIKPDIVINCIGIIKQLPISNDPLTAITINAQLPHRIAQLSRDLGARMIHISTDCVFDGKKGIYTEDDIPSADDLYGRTKLLGEVSYPHCVTLRTSIIGHELKSQHGLVEWFLGQTGKVRGYQNAIYSGFPTIEFARIIHKYVLPNPDLSGIYHVSSAPISKFDLLGIIAEKYRKRIDIEPYEHFVQNRSLKSDLFRSLTSYVPPDWPELVDGMYKDYNAHKEQYRI